MGRLNLVKLGSMLAFLILASFSCYWTAESLYIWNPMLTVYGAWLISIVFYVIASLCFSKMLNSTDRYGNYTNKTGGQTGQFLLGLLGLIVFWIFLSLPTNTHTLLYRASIKDVATVDLERTKGYLTSLKDNNVEIKKIETEYTDKELQVASLLERMRAEIDHPGQLGIADRFNTILLELDNVLGASIQRRANVGTTKKEWLITIQYYANQARQHLKILRADADRRIQTVRNNMNAQDIDKLIYNCDAALSDIHNMNDVDNDIVSYAVKDLTEGYAYIGKNAEYVDFKDADKERYTKEGAIPETKAMLSVPDVWKDYITTDKYAGRGFIWLVLIALLVDIAAFIFFNIAFNKKNNNAIA